MKNKMNKELNELNKIFDLTLKANHCIELGEEGLGGKIDDIIRDDFYKAISHISKSAIKILLTEHESKS